MALRTWRKSFKNNIIYLTILALIELLRALPEKMAMAAMAKLGKLAYYLAANERQKTVRHLKKVFAATKDTVEIERLARQVFENIGRNACAAIRIPHYFRPETEALVRIEGADFLDKALARGKGVLGVTGHIGCWELLAAYLVQRGYPLAVVGKPLYDERLDKILVKHREQSGLINISRDGAARKMMQWLKAGKMLGVLIDQDTDVESEFVDFLGIPARTPITPMLLAQRTGSAIVPMAIHLQKDGAHIIQIQSEIKLEADDGMAATRKKNLLKCSKAIEAFILAHPAQWVWMHERWKTRPDNKVSKADK